MMFSVMTVGLMILVMMVALCVVNSVVFKWRLCCVRVMITNNNGDVMIYE